MQSNETKIVDFRFPIKDATRLKVACAQRNQGYADLILEALGMFYSANSIQPEEK